MLSQLWHVAHGISLGGGGRKILAVSVFGARTWCQFLYDFGTFTNSLATQHASDKCHYSVSQHIIWQAIIATFFFTTQRKPHKQWKCVCYFLLVFNYDRQVTFCYPSCTICLETWLGERVYFGTCTCFWCSAWQS